MNQLTPFTIDDWVDEWTCEAFEEHKREVSGVLTASTMPVMVHGKPYDPVTIYISDLKKQFWFADALLFAVTAYYPGAKKRKKIPTDFRDIFDEKLICYDSGGFSLLMQQQIKAGEKMKIPDPLDTVKIYKKMGYQDDDILIQLDLPPEYYQTHKERMEKIKTNVEFFEIMQSEISIITPVVHGWLENEIDYTIDNIGQRDQYCVGSNLALTVRPQKRVKMELILDRLVMVIQKLEDKRVMCLGAGNPNFALILFALGFKATDGCSWRRDAGFGRVYIFEDTPTFFRNGKKYKRLPARQPRDSDYQFIKYLISEHHYYPFFGMTFEELSHLLATKSSIRALHNAYVTKMEEWKANTFVNDPDGLIRYLRKRWAKAKSSYYLKILNYMVKRIKRKQVQDNLDIYLKGKIT